MLQKEQRANTFAFFRIQQKAKKMTALAWTLTTSNKKRGGAS